MKYLSLSIDGTPIPAPEEIPTGGLNTSGFNLIEIGLTLFLILAVVLALFFLIWGGIDWTMSRGDKEKIQSARQKLIYAVLGLMVVFLSFVLINIIGGVFGLQDLIGR